MEQHISVNKAEFAGDEGGGRKCFRNMQEVERFIKDMNE